MGKNPSGRFVLKVEELRLAPQLQQDPAYLQALQDTAVLQQQEQRGGQRQAQTVASGASR